MAEPLTRSRGSAFDIEAIRERKHRYALQAECDIDELLAENERLREWPAKLLKLIEESWYDDRFGEGAYARALESTRAANSDSGNTNTSAEPAE